MSMDYGRGWGDPARHGMADGWSLVGKDPNKKHHFLVRCLECGCVESRLKYLLGKSHECSDCWYVRQVLERPRIWPRLAPLIQAFGFRAGRTELEELERMYGLSDERPLHDDTGGF